MIRQDELIEVGHIVKPHGINGELSVTLDEPDVDLSELKCIVLDIDGLFVPFFVESVRSRGAASVLVTIDGISDEKQAAPLGGKTVWALRDDLDFDDDAESDGFYAEDFIGYSLTDVEKGEIGLINAINDVTDNVLFIVDRPDGSEVFVPVAEEFFREIDTENKRILMELPTGLLEL